MTARKTSATDKPAGKRAAPTVFTPKLGEEICARIAEGRSVAKVAKLKGMPNKATIFRWLAAADEAPVDGDEGKQRPFDAFRQLYLQARKFRADARFESIDEITEELRKGKEAKYDAHTARVLIEAIKWQAGKENQGRYGEAVTLRGDKDNPVQVQQRTIVELSEAELNAVAAKGLSSDAG